jgi:hypothetical protein
MTDPASPRAINEEEEKPPSIINTSSFGKQDKQRDGEENVIKY